MPAGLDDWDRSGSGATTIPDDPRAPAAQRRADAPGLARSTRCGRYPWQPKQNTFSKEGTDLGIPARVFPQWLRCTGCDYPGPAAAVHLHQHPPVPPDLAQFTHRAAPGAARTVRRRKARRESPAVPGPAPVDLHQRPPRRVPVRPVGAPRRAVPQSRVPGAQDARPQRRARARSAIIRCASCGGTARHGRSPGRGRARASCRSVPGPPPAPERVRPRMRRRARR